MSFWRRPYTVPSQVAIRELVAAVIVVASGALMLTFAAAGEIDDARAGVAATVAAITTVYVARMHLVGVFVSNRGVLVRAFESTVEIPWPAVTWIDILPSAEKTAPDGPLLAIWISTVDGQQIETPLLRCRPAMGTAHVLSAYLPCADFDQAFRELRAMQARRRAQPPVRVESTA